MKLFIHPNSGISFWLCQERQLAQLSMQAAEGVGGLASTKKVASYLSEACPWMPLPIHVFAQSGSRANRQMFALHRFPPLWEDVPFFRMIAGVYVPSPEACLVAMANSLDAHEFIFLGNTLCGNFFVNPLSQLGLGSRCPVTTPEKLESFLKNHPGIRGRKACERLLPFLSAGSDSPPEIFMKMQFGLPPRYGGYSFEHLTANHEHPVSARARTISGRNVLRPDLVIAHGGKQVAIEYDSDAVHLSRVQAMRDESKRLALESDGFKVISIRPAQLVDRHYMNEVAGECRRYLGLRAKKSTPEFAANQMRLFQLDRSYGRYFAQTSHVCGRDTPTPLTQASKL